MYNEDDMTFIPYIQKQAQPVKPKTNFEEAPVDSDSSEKFVQNLQSLEEGELAVDVYETNDAVIIQSTIAGVRAEDLDITLAGDMLTIKGERKKDINIPEFLALYQECFWGAFSRSIILPVEVKFEQVEAKMKNGVLTLTLPKAHKERTKTISVKNEEE